MSKRKILSLTLGLCMVAILAVGGTLAYFTDTDEATNTFTVGGVNIELVEQERKYVTNEETGLKTVDGLQPFTQNKNLMPLVGSAQGAKETVGGVEGLPTAAAAQNYVDKIITVKNTGNSAAYMRVFVAIPEELDNVADAGKNILHFNTSVASAADKEWGAEVLAAKSVLIGDDGVKYNVYYRTYQSPVAKTESTKTPAYIGFYLDSGVDMNEDGKYTINGTVIDMDLTKGISIPVFAQGVQIEGFDNAEDAFTAAKLPTNPWAE